MGPCSAQGWWSRAGETGREGEKSRRSLGPVCPEPGAAGRDRAPGAPRRSRSPGAPELCCHSPTGRLAVTPRGRGTLCPRASWSPEDGVAGRHAPDTERDVLCLSTRPAAQGCRPWTGSWSPEVGSARQTCLGPSEGGGGGEVYKSRRTRTGDLAGKRVFADVTKVKISNDVILALGGALNPRQVFLQAGARGGSTYVSDSQERRPPAQGRPEPAEPEEAGRILHRASVRSMALEPGPELRGHDCLL